jgi:hypothetical protein
MGNTIHSAAVSLIVYLAVFEFAHRLDPFIAISPVTLRLNATAYSLAT